jgi:hypothetical protein
MQDVMLLGRITICTAVVEDIEFLNARCDASWTHHSFNYYLYRCEIVNGISQRDILCVSVGYSFASLGYR